MTRIPNDRKALYVAAEIIDSVCKILTMASMRSGKKINTNRRVLRALPCGFQSLCHHATGRGSAATVWSMKAASTQANMAARA